MWRQNYAGTQASRRRMDHKAINPPRKKSPFPPLDTTKFPLSTMASRRRSVSGYERQRRPHSKSRMGCDNCKRRRIKCSEQFPQCIECTRHKVVCSYSRMAPEDQQRWLSKKSDDQRGSWSAAAADPDLVPQGVYSDHLAWIPVQYHFPGSPGAPSGPASAPPSSGPPLQMGPPMAPPIHHQYGSSQLPPLQLPTSSPLALPTAPSSLSEASASFYHQQGPVPFPLSSAPSLGGQGSQGLPHMVSGQSPIGQSLPGYSNVVSGYGDIDDHYRV
ncbi:hypothetical protein DIRU0_C24674 [Diutina rugosa]